MPNRNIKLDKDGVKVVRFFMDHPEREMTPEGRRLLPPCSNALAAPSSMVILPLVLHA
jgi:hypothetical protein